MTEGGGPGVDAPWIDEASFWFPPRAVSSAWHEHAPFAFWLMRNLRPRTIAELGTHNGFSFFVWCEAISRLRLDTTAIAIDSWQGDEHAGFYSESVYESVRRIAEEEYPEHAVLKRGYFDDFVEETPDGSVDLLHIDGRHRYEDVKHDFESWLPKVSDRGVVVFHDTNEYKKDFGVWKFWAEISERYESFEFRHGHGLGVLLVGDAVPDVVRDAITAARLDPTGMRADYVALGARVREWVNGTVAADKVAALQSRNAELRRRNEELLASTSWRVTTPLRAVKGAFIRRRER